jgi:P27 family predicted phage terminase small subunit
VRGRKPKATVLRVLQHNPGNRPYNEHEPAPAPLDPACPAELCDDPQASAEWTRGIAPAIALGHITSADRVLAIAHCQLWATWQTQLAAAREQPHIIPSPNGYPVPNPVRGQANKTLMMLVRIDSELGFSPTSRTRVQAKPREKAQPTPAERQKAEYR